ncbi:hypothetical protein [Kordia antarctica]|nr:hypothetical protein [Kordia antarctica]
MNVEGVQNLSKEIQQVINGGAQQPYTCRDPYLIRAGDTCDPGYHMHRQGHCVCCLD